MDNYEMRWYKALDDAAYLDFLRYWQPIGELRPCDCSSHQAIRAHIIAHGFGAHDVKKSSNCLLCTPELQEYYLVVDMANPILRADC